MYVDTGSLVPGHRRGDDAHFLSPEQTALAGVRIQGSTSSLISNPAAPRVPATLMAVSPPVSTSPDTLSIHQCAYHLAQKPSNPRADLVPAKTQSLSRLPGCLDLFLSFRRADNKVIPVGQQTPSRLVQPFQTRAVLPRSSLLTCNTFS